VKYTVRELDTETGDYYYRARYYDANVGRFIGEDPLGFEAGDANLSRYVGNSPTNFVDPSGLQVLLKPVRLPKINSSPSRPGQTPKIFPLGDSDYNEMLDKVLPLAKPGAIQPLIDRLQELKLADPQVCTDEGTAIKIVSQTGQKNDKGCKTLPVFRGSEFTDRYEQYVTKSVHSIVVYSPRLKEVQAFDGLTPNTNYIWEVKSHSDKRANDLRAVWINREAVKRNGSSDERDDLATVEGFRKQKNRSKRIADDCGYKFRYGVRTEAMQSFLADPKRSGGLGFPDPWKNQYPVVVEYHPWNN
jgi:RHS repeat-associated protein